MAWKDLLKGIFGWGPRTSSRTSTDSNNTDSEFDVVNPGTGSLSDRYHDEMSYRHIKRRDRYDIYDAMDMMSDVASVLDAYAEDSTQYDRRHESTVWIESSDKKVREELTKLLKDINAEEWIEGVARDTGKFGDDFARVVGGPKDGVKSLEWVNPRDVERIESKDGVLVGFEWTHNIDNYRRKLKDDGTTKPTLKPWDMIHWRIYKQKRLPNQRFKNIYGTSLLYSSERIAKQVKILDDLLMIVRLTRSLDRKVYYVDVGRSPVEEEVRILKRWRRALKRKIYMDPSTGRFDSRFDPYAWTEDEFWPTKENSQSRVETQSGLGSVGEMVDIEHFRDKFFGSLRAPKAYFGYEGDVNAKATLSSQSLKWGRAVDSLQRAVRNGLTRLCQIHLAYKGINPDADKFTVMMVTPSILELLDRLEGWQSTIDVAERMSTLGEVLNLDKYEWTLYILENVLWLSKDETKRFAKGIPKDIVNEPPESDNKSEPEEPEEPASEPKPPEQPEPEPSKQERLLEIDKAIERTLIRKSIGAKKSELPNWADNRESSPDASS